MLQGCPGACRTSRSLAAEAESRQGDSSPVKAISLLLCGQACGNPHSTLGHRAVPKGWDPTTSMGPGNRALEQAGSCLSSGLPYPGPVTSSNRSWDSGSVSPSAARSAFAQGEHRCLEKAGSSPNPRHVSQPGRAPASRPCSVDPQGGCIPLQGDCKPAAWWGSARGSAGLSPVDCSPLASGRGTGCFW